MYTGLQRKLATTLLFLVALAVLPTIAFASHSWGGYHWGRASGSFTLVLGDNVSTEWKYYLQNASTEWSLSSVLTTEIGTGNVTNPKNCKPTSGRVEVCATTYGFNGWLGVAQIWISGGHITQGTVKLNNTYFNTAKYNTAGWKNMVICQEIGHTFGLDHQDEDFSNGNLGSCMDYTNDPLGPPNNEYPNQHDYDQLNAIYLHLDQTTTVGQTGSTDKGRVPPPFEDADVEDAVEVGTGQWGKLIRSTNGGRTELFELDLGAGRKLFTRVIWADPEDEAEPGQDNGRGRR
ncbi:MAG: hypothetical protein GEU77_03940 [Deltaproteobacteria bacterium]|nr:hypothetical protein [Deltaproteobacteria bacterium]